MKDVFKNESYQLLSIEKKVNVNRKIIINNDYERVKEL